MKTLVYFASGPPKPAYQQLDYDRVILIDNCFGNRSVNSSPVFNKGKVTCIGMDCLRSIQYLKNNGVEIDCFVSLNEGLNEGGGSYAINSDFFLGYVMPLLKDQYLHIMSKSYYGGQYRVSMNLPYDKVEILNDHEAYLAPNTFSDYRRFIDRAQVFQMTRTSTIREISIPSKIKVSVHHDSIWNHYDDLDVLGVSCISRDQRFFFESIHKTIELSRASIEGILNYCEVNKLERLGLTPWAKGKYASFIQKVRNYRADYPKKIQLFHLNKNDYKILKEYSEDKE